MESIIDISKPTATMMRSKMNVLDILKFFEHGEENIYLLDEVGRFGWQVIQSRNFRFQMNTDGNFVLKVSSLAPIIFTAPIDEENKSTLLKACEAGFEQNAGVFEIPVVRADGHIVAVARKQAKSDVGIEWSKLIGIKSGFLQGKYYITSDDSPKLKGAFDFLQKLADVELVSNQNLRDALSGKNGTLVYERDIYPDIPKISAEELYQMMLRLQKFENNKKALESFDGFKRKFSDADVPIEKKDFSIESCIKSFLLQVESDFPVLLLDAYDIEEITWICDKLRSTDKFGADNHLYLQYTSWPKFLASLCNFDWTYIVSTGKVVFLFSEDDKAKYYPMKANAGKPQELDVSEINEIINSIQRGFSGSDFFNMILDSHPSLLTIGWHGLPTFAALWKVFCEGKNVKDAIEHLRNPKDKKELNLRDANLSNMLKYHYNERMEPFLEELSNYLQLDEKYPMIDWFKAFYLSSNSIIGRKFLQRISPAIFYDEHGMNQLYVKDVFGISEEILKLEMIKGFKYQRRVGVVRHPVSRFGCRQNSLIRGGKFRNGSWRTSPLAAIKGFTMGETYGRYLSEKDHELLISRQVRFEDLKLYPKETSEKLCEFLRIPWSESCLCITTNGEDSGKVDGTKGFDVTPVYKKHLEYLSTLDYYRIELLNYKNFDVWGYKPKYYDGIKYTAEELEKLFAIPFKIENMTHPKWPGWPNKEACKEFHKMILDRAIDVMKNGEKMPAGYKGQPVKLVECLYPDLKPGERLFE